MRQIFLDTETTGLSPESGDRVIEIGCVEMVNRRLTGRNLHFYVNPERASSDDAVKVHGLSDEFLADKPLFAAVADELLEHLTGAEVIIHNASFDVGFLDMELKRLGRPPLAQCVGARHRQPGDGARAVPGQVELARCAVPPARSRQQQSRTLHGALLDAGLLAEVYIRMTRGQDSLVIDGTDIGAASTRPDRRSTSQPSS